MNISFKIIVLSASSIGLYLGGEGCILRIGREGFRRAQTGVFGTLF
jgi:hypothetical protein